MQLIYSQIPFILGNILFSKFPNASHTFLNLLLNSLEMNLLACLGKFILKVSSLAAAIGIK